jgi:hypothetical protein
MTESGRESEDICILTCGCSCETVITSLFVFANSRIVIKVEVEKKGPPLSLLFQQATWGITGVWIGSAQDGSP